MAVLSSERAKAAAAAAAASNEKARAAAAAAAASDENANAAAATAAGPYTSLSSKLNIEPPFVAVCP